MNLFSRLIVCSDLKIKMLLLCVRGGNCKDEFFTIQILTISVAF